MTATDDERALLVAVLASPAEDTVRLVYADWLDENDTSRADHAELIRVQVELELSPAYRHLKVENGLPDGLSKEYHHAYGLRIRERELLARNPQWVQAKCPGCDGKGKLAYGYLDDYGDRCFTCGGTGDLFSEHYPHHEGTAGRMRPLSWDRGFLTVGTRTTEVMREVQLPSGLGERKYEWQPTSWGKAIAALPMVMGVELVGLETMKLPPEPAVKGKPWIWHFNKYVHPATAPHNPPLALQPFLNGDHPFDDAMYYYSTPERAIRALSFATMWWLRGQS